ncbi:MAG: PAS domain S-box protein, partial [Bacteroidales bacterium]|nr:PAS domain S-box protein [Bacteroidales bacterium]
DRDITDRKKVEGELRKAEQQYRALVENSHGVIYTITADGTITFVSPSVQKLIGYEPDEVLHKNLDTIICKDDMPIYADFLKQTAASGLIRQGVEYRIFHKNGSMQWHKSVLTPVYDEMKNLTHFVGNAIDITTSKMAEEHLLKAKMKAEESDRLKSVFLANVSHEIRTPMNAILGFLELLKQPDLEGDKKDMYVDIVNQSGQRLLTTINDIIEISKIEAGQSEVIHTDVSIAETLNYHYTLFKEQADVKGLHLKLSYSITGDDLTIKTDKQKLEGIFTNLLGNAIKFTHHGSVEFGCMVKDNLLEIFVKDTGIGIEPDRISAVFDRFVQADLSVSRPYQGSGLGLSIVKAYTDLLGGNIRVESEVGKGTAFFVTIPFTPGTKKSGISWSANNISDTLPGKITVLVAEDDEFSYRYLEKILSDKNITLLHTLNGEETLKCLQENSGINLVLMDIKMPGINGLEATKLIREFNKKIPVIAQTAYAFTGDRERFISAGCNDYISKPLSRAALLELIRKYALQEAEG